MASNQLRSIPCSRASGNYIIGKSDYMKQTENANPVFILPSKKSPDYAASLEYVNQMNKTGKVYFRCRR